MRRTWQRLGFCAGLLATAAAAPAAEIALERSAVDKLLAQTLRFDFKLTAK